MARKSAKIRARVQPEIKQQAEAILAERGLSVSVLIDNLYRQIIASGDVPYTLLVPKIPRRSNMTEAQLRAMMETGYRQAKRGQTQPIDEALARQICQGVLYTAQTWQSPERARCCAELLYREMAELHFLPSRYPLVNEEPWHSRGIYKMLVQSFGVYYLIDEINRSVTIIAIIYERRRG